MKKIKISIVINIMIFLLVVFGLIIGLAGIPFLGAKGRSSFGYLIKYFTVESNLFMGITALLLGINQILFLKKDIKINKIIFILDFIASVSVAITLFTVLFFLGPVVYNWNFLPLYSGVSFFYHLVVPVLGMVVFILFESTNEFNILKTSIFGIIPFLVYSVFYIIASISHMDNGKVQSGYDWYGFLSFGIPIFILLMFIMLGATFLISFLILKLNRITYKEN